MVHIGPWSTSISLIWLSLCPCNCKLCLICEFVHLHLPCFCPSVFPIVCLFVNFLPLQTRQMGKIPKTGLTGCRCQRCLGPVQLQFSLQQIFPFHNTFSTTALITHSSKNVFSRAKGAKNSLDFAEKNSSTFWMTFSSQFFSSLSFFSHLWALYTTRIRNLISSDASTLWLPHQAIVSRWG